MRAFNRIGLVASAIALAGGCSSTRTSSSARRPTSDRSRDYVLSRVAAPSQAVVPDLSGPLRLESLLPLLIERNPGLKAAHARVEAAAQRYPQAISLPDPMIEGKYFARNAMAGDRDYVRYELMLRQEIPFPGVLRLKGKEALKEAEAEALRYEAAVRDAVVELKDVHAERAYLVGAAAAEGAVKEVYRRYAEITRADATAGRTSLPESFRAEALLAQAGYDLDVLAEIRAVEDQRLLALLALPTDTSLGDPADAAPLIIVSTDAGELVRRAEAYNQELRAAGVDAERACFASERARLTYIPTVTLGAGHMVNDDFASDTGRLGDSNVVTLGVTIPIGPRHGAEVLEAEANERAARWTEVSERTRVRREVSKAAFRLRNAGRLAELYGKTLVPQAEQALLRSEEMVKTGTESRASSLELAATWQQLRIAQLRALADHAQALAMLERLLGTTVAPIAGEKPK